MDNYILIVEDDPAIARLCRTWLENAGYQVVLAPTGHDALAFVRGSAPQLILLDIMMPGMSGLELLYRLRKSTLSKRVPVVIVSALFDQRFSDLPGVIRYLVKGSFTLDDLLSTVRAAIGAPTDAPALS